MGDILIGNIVKDVGGIFALASTVAYVSGYLVLRSRAHALGTDSAFKLLDETYVFAGVRFFFITLIVLLLLSPVIFAVHWVCWRLFGYIPTGLTNSVQWGVLVMVAIVSLMTFKIFSVNGLLLQQDLNTSDSVAKKAVMGEPPIIGLLLTFSLVFLTTLSVLWLKARFATSKEPFVWLLGIVIFIQIFMLPIYHGALFADRKVRVLSICPDSVREITGPLAIVGHTSEHYTLLGCNLDGNRQLVSIKSEDINGIPIKKIVKLNTFIKEDLASCNRKKDKQAGNSGTNNKK